MIVFPEGRNAWYGKSVPSMNRRSQSDSASVAAPHPSRPVIPTDAGLSASRTSFPRYANDTGAFSVSESLSTSSRA